MAAPRSKKVSASRAKTNVQHRFNPIRDLTPEKLGRYLDCFDRGQLRDAALVWDKIRRRDAQVGAVIGKRERSCALLDWEILTTEDSPDAQAQKDALEYFYNNIRTGNALDGNQAGGFSLLVKQMMSAVGNKYAAHEIIWKPQATTAEGPRIKAELVQVPLWFFENTTGRLRFIESDYAIEGRDLEENGWVITVGEGLMEATSVAYIFKNLTLKDWVFYSEKFGVPGRHGKTDAAPDSPEWDRFVDAVEAFGNDFAIVTGMSAEIKELAFGAKGELPFPQLVDYMDRTLAVLWRGGDLSTNSAGAGDVGANAQGEEKDEIAEADALMISETLNEQLDRPALRYLFGTDEPLAYVRIKNKTRPDVQAERSIDEFLIGAGVPIAVDDLAERYGRPMATADKVLAKRAAPMGLPFANERRETSGVAKLAAFNAAGRAEVAKALAASREPLRKRIEQILAMENEQQQAAALTRLKASLPEFLGPASKDPQVIKAFENYLGTAFASAAAEGAQQRLSQS